MDTEINLDNLPYREEVSAFVLNDNKEFLVVFSAYKNKFCKLPAGGVESGETEEEAILRKIKEELDLDVEILYNTDVRYYYQRPKEQIIKRNLKFRGSTGVVFITKVNPKNQKVKLQKEEVSNYKWIKKEDIYNYLKTQEQIETAEQVINMYPELF